MATWMSVLSEALFHIPPPIPSPVSIVGLRSSHHLSSTRIWFRNFVANSDPNSIHFLISVITSYPCHAAKGTKSNPSGCVQVLITSGGSLLNCPLHLLPTKRYQIHICGFWC